MAEEGEETMTILYLDRSRIVTRQECEMSRYLGYHAQGKGLTTPAPKHALVLGLCIHTGVETLFITADVEMAVNTMKAYYSKEHPLTDENAFLWHEQWWLVEGLLRGFHRVRYPLIMEDFEVVETEVEREVELVPGVHLMVRFDVVLRRKGDGLLVVFDYKTLSYLTEDWQKQHEISLQTLLYTWAARQIFKSESGIGIQYEGLLKGLKKKETARGSQFFEQRIQQSPFCYAWHLESAGLWQTTWPHNAKGWKKVAIWEHFTPAEWHEALVREGKLNELFPVIPVVLPTQHDQEAAISQALRAEMDFQGRLQELAQNIQSRVVGGEDAEERRVYWERILFEQTKGRCYKYGLDNGCPFIGYCFNESAALAPLEHGFIERTPHHDAEMKDAL